MNRPFIYRKLNQGSILIVCLWVIMILAILGLGITGLVFQEIRFSKAYSRLVVSLPLAQGALRSVFYLRGKDATPLYDTWDELTKEESMNLCVNNAYRYFFVDKKNSPDSAEIIDESALINLNLASADVLARLPGMNKELAEAIVNSGLRPFSTINEVLLVKDISKENFLLFKDLVTVYGIGKININTASKTVLITLGLDEEMANLVVRFRRENKIKPIKGPAVESGEEPEVGISNLATLLEDLKNFASLSLRQEQDFLVILPVLDVKSEYLRFNVIAMPGGQEGLHYSITIHSPTKAVLSWAEY